MDPINERRLLNWGSLVCVAWLSIGMAGADIIDDIELLENPKKKKTNEEKAASEEEKPLEVLPAEVPPAQPPLPPPPIEKPLELPKIEPMPPPEKGVVPSSGKLDKESRRKLPVRFSSEGPAVYSQNGAFAQFEKNVVIVQEDVRLQSDQANVKMLKNESNNVDSAEMIGRVSMARYSKDPAERITARGDRAVFDNAAQVVTLDGNARLWRDGHLIKGDRIVYEIVSGTVKVDKVQGVVQPEKAGK